MMRRPTSLRFTVLAIAVALVASACGKKSNVEDAEQGRINEPPVRRQPGKPPAEAPAPPVRDGTTDAAAVLGVINNPNAGVGTLVSLGLSNRVATNIVNWRNGPDKKAGTDDDRVFGSLADLDNLPFVGRGVYDQLLSSTQHPIWDAIYWVLDSAAFKWLILIMLLVMPLASLLTWAERRQSAMMQDRLGPNRANIGPIKLKGILHFVADALKMISKEDFVPANVHKILFGLAPILALAPVLIAFCIIPFGPTVYTHSLGQTLDTYNLAVHPEMMKFAQPIRMQIFQIDFGLIFYFAILTLANYGGTIAGWASYNKWALLGGLRSSSQMMSYEVAMGLALMGAFLLTGTLEPGAIVAQGTTHAMQPSNPLNWLWLSQPLGLLLFFTAAIAETKRAPFDIPEGEPEIIGYFVEYSGMRWGMFFLAEFIEIVFISAVITCVFFGGYHFPFLDPDGFRFGGYLDPNGVWTSGTTLHLHHWAVVLIQVASFGAKVVLLCWFQLLIRWTLPRFRADQLMNLGWKLLLPLALVNIMATALIYMPFLR